MLEKALHTGRQMLLFFSKKYSKNSSDKMIKNRKRLKKEEYMSFYIFRKHSGKLHNK